MADNKSPKGPFDHSYGARFLEEQPAFPSKLIEYPSSRSGGRLVHITPVEGAAWLGRFAFGETNGPDQLVACLHPDWLAVVVHGVAYLVNSQNPEDWNQVGVKPVRSTKSVKTAEILLFIGDCEIEGWDAGGFAWRSSRLSLRGLKGFRIAGNKLRGEGWYPDCWEEFTLDLRTGEHRGGPDLSGYIGLGPIWSEERWNWSQLRIVKLIGRFLERIGNSRN